MLRQVCLCALLIAPIAVPQAANRGIPSIADGRLWVSPDNIESRNLLYGSGGESRKPKSDHFVFVKEDMDGTNPKIIVKDADGVEWKAKMGSEARPEVAASRLIWAAGYFTRDYYYMPSIQVENLPELERGNHYVLDGGRIEAVRLMRNNKHEKKVGEWAWKESPFANTREFNGLRALLALINDWDLKDVNNVIYDLTESDSATPRRIYMVSDLGATFGTAGIVASKRTARGNLESYRSSKFIVSTKPDVVDFGVPGRPQWLLAVGLPGYINRAQMQWIGKNVPRQDAAWMGRLLSRLSPKQIRDAFRGAGFSPEEVEGFATIVEGRIAELRALGSAQ
jgi:hypothetical protein